MTFEKIRAIIVDQLGVEEDMINMETNMMKDLEADSLDAVEIILGVEDEFEIEIPDDVAEELETVSDLVAYVDENLDK